MVGIGRPMCFATRVRCISRTRGVTTGASDGSTMNATPVTSRTCAVGSGWWRRESRHRRCEARELVRYRAKLERLGSGLKAQVHAVMAKEGVRPGFTDMFGPASSS